MPVPARPPAPPPALPRIRLALYAAAALVALALWLIAPQFVAQDVPVAEVATPQVNVAALDTIGRDLDAWSQLLADPRLDQLQPASQLQPARPGNFSPFVRESAPAQ